MKNFFFIFITILVFVSCNNDVKTEVDIIEAGRIHYFKDIITGLCYAEVNEGRTDYSFTCVPCDSIAKIEANKLKLKN